LLERFGITGSVKATNACLATTASSSEIIVSRLVGLLAVVSS
jgi:hypothetical protein